MGYMKNALTDKVQENLANISIHYDGEAESLICKKLEEANTLLWQASQLFAEINATFDAYVEENSEGIDSNTLWDKCEAYMEECTGDADAFSEWWEELKNIGD